MESILSVRTEGELLPLFDEEGNEWCHFLFCQSDGLAFACTAIVQVEASVAVPVTIEKLVNLVSGRLDEHEIVQVVAERVVTIGFVTAVCPTLLCLCLLRESFL